MHLVEEFADHVKKHGLFSSSDLLLLAVSGGMDSVTLCDLCHRAGFTFEIAHANFQLRGEASDADETFVCALGARYAAKVHVKKFDTQEFAHKNNLSVQVAARELRYRWFREILQNGPACVLTAHHADDNVETMLMNFFRGTGITGLRGILPKQGNVVRPLLPFSRKTLETYAINESLSWREDASNETDKYTRNYFRHTIIPLVKKVFPETDHNLFENIRRFADVEILYLQAIAQHKKNW